MELGVHAGEWSALPCGSAAPPAERDYPLAKGSNNTHTHTHEPPPPPRIFGPANPEGYPGYCTTRLVRARSYLDPLISTA
jgi:hypothetical protein